MAPRPNPKTLTFWIVLGCGAICGAATASAGPGGEPQEVPPAAAEALPSAAALADGPAIVDAEPAFLRPRREPAPAAPEPGSSGLASTVAVLALLCGAAAIAWHWRGRRPGLTGPGASDTLEVVCQRRLGGRWQVALMRVQGRLLVVGAGEKGLSLLAELDDLTPAPWAADEEEEDAEPPVLELDTYRRPAQRPASTPTPAQPAQRQGEDVFLDHLMDRLAKAQPAVVRATTRPPDERAALRQRVQGYRRGPTRL